MPKSADKNYFVISDPLTGKFWDGTFPSLYGGGKHGKMATCIQRWKPKMSVTPKKWALKSTADNKLRRYAMVQIVRPDLADLAIQEYKVAPVLVSEITCASTLR